MINVVAALIWDENKFLICQRAANKSLGLLWEFVGGKVNNGENNEQALVRECFEELGIVLSVDNLFMESIHEYPDYTVNLSLYNAKIIKGVPQCFEHNDLRWITLQEIPRYEFCPADKTFLKQLEILYSQ